MIDLTPTNPTSDAVVVVPGALGSQLWRGNDLVWGMRPKPLARALRTGLRDLDAGIRLEGRDDGIRARGLLSAPAFIPGLISIAPYGELVKGLRPSVLHPDAILQFAYDWRLSSRHNARELASACDAHIRKWRAHPKGDPQAGLRFVCHSLGGLVALAFCAFEGGASETRQIVTVGTPFKGAVKAVRALADGDLLPFGLARDDLRDTLRSFPALYELLPRTASLRDGTDLRQPTLSDFSSLGIPEDRTRDAVDFRDELGPVIKRLRASADPLDVWAVVGNIQPTLAAFSINSGEATYVTATAGLPGDGTVPLESASLGGMQPTFLHQRHVALTATPEALHHIRCSLARVDPGQDMGTDGVGLDVPDSVRRGEPIQVTVYATPGHAIRVTLTNLEPHASQPQRVDAAPSRQPGPRRVELAAPLTEGLVQISATGAGGSASYEYVLVE